MVDNTLSAMRLAMSGVFETYAAAPIIIPHVRATLPYLMSRLDGRVVQSTGPWRRPVDLVQTLGCTESEREQMLHGNAARLFTS